jgi:hypothetical protein
MKASRRSLGLHAKARNATNSDQQAKFPLSINVPIPHHQRLTKAIRVQPRSAYFVQVTDFNQTNPWHDRAQRGYSRGPSTAVGMLCMMGGPVRVLHFSSTTRQSLGEGPMERAVYTRTSKIQLFGNHSLEANSKIRHSGSLKRA